MDGQGHPARTHRFDAIKAITCATTILSSARAVLTSVRHRPRGYSEVAVNVTVEIECIHSRRIQQRVCSLSELIG